jgi:hypothetical protein
MNVFCACFSVTFLAYIYILQFTKEKGGIHDIYRIFMDTFGWYRLTGVRSTKYLLTKKSGSPSDTSGGFLFLS